MEEKQQWRLALIFALVILALACCRTAYGDELVLPAGTTIQLPRGAGSITLHEEMFLVERASIDEHLTAAEMERRLTEDLLKCSVSLEAATRPEPTWKVAIRWTATGLAIGAAFGFGLYLGH